ncbi:MAG: DUF4267 domain-containing protein [Hyphomicrobiaceae bacterium]
MSTGRHRGALRVLAALTGVVLLVIGIRFLLAPHQASRFFGIAAGATGTADLHYVIGVRDIWLAAIVVVLSALSDWRGLAIWLGLGVFVCAADAAIAAHSSGKAMAVAFHLASGLFCGALAVACWRISITERAD